MNGAEQSAQQAARPSRPNVWLVGIQFRDGTYLNLSPHEIIVFVGPNNAGKSAALRDVDGRLSNHKHGCVVVDRLDYDGSSNIPEFSGWLDFHQKAGTQIIQMPFGMMERDTAMSRWERALGGDGLRNLLRLFAIHLSTEDRLQAANQVGNVNFASEPPTHPLHHLFDGEDELEIRLSRMVRQAFGADLVVNRGAGSQILLHLGERPHAPRGDRAAKAYRDAVTALPTLQSQGDGIRAFVGVLLHTLVIDHDIILIDEPEAFLHPPQAAALGRLLAVETPEPRQLIVATHSSDFLRGVLDAPNSSVRVVRIRRDGNKTHVRELAPINVRELWRDPLLRYSNILDGLFHDGVVVCEGDADCRFYGAMTNAVAGAEQVPDLLFTHTGGKARVGTVVKALRAIDVPVKAVLDFDILRDETEIRTIYEALGGKWDEVQQDFRTVNASIQKKRPELSVKEVRQRIADALDSVAAETLPRKVAEEITAAVRNASPWAEAKRVGAAFIPSGQETQAFTRLASALREAGLYIVEVGELEQFCKSVAGHGPRWVLSVMEKDLKTDPELDGARTFARSLIVNW